MVHTRAVVVVILAAASLGGWWLGRVDRGSESQSAFVVRAVDGDTIDVRIGAQTDTVRLLGIDTPETHHPTKPVGCFGPEAAAYTKAQLEGRTVTLEADVEPRDIYHRRLAYVYIAGHRFNDELLQKGYARLLVIPPNGSHARTMLAEELEAKRNGVGLWGAC
ncbi:MAG: thermonuclease family protein [Acidimicrobiia bacterium]